MIQTISTKCQYNPQHSTSRASATLIFPVKEYDILYENQKDLDHPVWREFDKKYKVGFEFKEDIKDIDFNREIIALWFFRERSDNNHPPGLMLKEKFIAYMPNHFLITKYKDITIKEAKRKFIRRPLIQLDIKKQQYEEIINKIK